ncbi:MAG: TolC family protein, partial [Pseudomonadota bacterium]
EYEAKSARPPQAATPPDPKFMVDFIGVPTGTADVSRGTVQYMVEQEIPFPTKLVYGYRAEKRAAEAALAGHAATAQEIRRQVKRAYLDLWRVAKEEAIDREALSIYRQSKGSSEEAYAAKKGPIADPVRASVELGEIEGRLAVLGQQRIEAAANLSKLMAQPLDPSVRVAEPPHIQRVAGVDDLIAKARNERPEIDEAARMTESEGARLAVAKSQYAPDFTLRWGFMDNPAGTPNAWYGRAGVTLPLWSLSKQRFGVRESKAMLARAESVKEAQLLSTEAEVKGAHARFVAAKRGADIYGGTVVPRARLLLRSSQEAYKDNKGDFLGVVDAIRSLTNAELMLVRSRVEAAQAEADIERAVGASLD